MWCVCVDSVKCERAVCWGGGPGREETLSNATGRRDGIGLHADVQCRAVNGGVWGARAQVQDSYVLAFTFAWARQQNQKRSSVRINVYIEKYWNILIQSDIMQTHTHLHLASRLRRRVCASVSALQLSRVIRFQPLFLYGS